MPVSVWREIVGSGVSPGGYNASSSLTTSMMGMCLQTSLCPCVNASSQWKHCPFFPRITISAGVCYLTIGGLPLTDACDDVGELEVPVRTVGAFCLVMKRLLDHAEVGDGWSWHVTLLVCLSVHDCLCQRRGSL
jgi:hypothetical protein